MSAEGRRLLPGIIRAGSLPLLAALAILLVAVPPASAATTLTATTTTTSPAPKAVPGPQLSISVDDGHPSAALHAKLAYTVTVINLGTTDAAGLHITQTVPNAAGFGSAAPAATAHAGLVTWTLDLKATKKAVFHTTMTVSSTPSNLLRLATVACASLSPQGAPIVCASDSDQLPAGLAAVQSAAAHPIVVVGSAPPAHGAMWWYVGGGAVLIVVLGSLIIWLTRHRRPAPQPE